MTWVPNNNRRLSGYSSAWFGVQSELLLILAAGPSSPPQGRRVLYVTLHALHASKGDVGGDEASTYWNLRPPGKRDPGEFDRKNSHVLDIYPCLLPALVDGGDKKFGHE